MFLLPFSGFLKGSSRIVNITESVHRVLFFVTLPSYQENFENVDFGTPSQNRNGPKTTLIFLKAYSGPWPTLPPYARENDDNSGRPPCVDRRHIKLHGLIVNGYSFIVTFLVL